MALEYDLRASTTLTPEEVLAHLAGLPGLERHGAECMAEGLFVTAIPESTLGRSVIGDQHGFKPSVNVLFRLDKFEGLEPGRATMLRCVLALPVAQAVLLFNGEHVVLLREHGRLILNEANTFWSPERRAGLGVPYQLRQFSPP